MSDYDAYVSFANAVKTLLNGEITVDTEKKPDMPYPYLIIQPGPVNPRSTWLSSALCQGWLVVRRQTNEPLVLTMGKALDKVLKATRDMGSITKYDWATTPERPTGTVTPKVIEVTDKMPGNDPDVERRVITWLLHSNSAV